MTDTNDLAQAHRTIEALTEEIALAARYGDPLETALARAGLAAASGALLTVARAMYEREARAAATEEPVSGGGRL